MKVKFKEPETAIWRIAKSISESNVDGVFSADDLSKFSSLTINKLTKEINLFCDQDIFGRIDEDRSKKPNSKDRVYCIREHPLTYGKNYEVLGIEADAYRILSDENTKPYGNDPVLFDPACFEIVDDTEPNFWKKETGEDGERYYYPSDWNQVGFFEDYHDGIEEVREKFWRDLKNYYPETWNDRNGKANHNFAAK